MSAVYRSVRTVHGMTTLAETQAALLADYAAARAAGDKPAEDAAAVALLESVRKLAVSIIHKHTVGRYLEFEDLLSQVNVELLSSLSRQVTVSGSFGSYAGGVIRNTIAKELERNRPMRLSPTWAWLGRICAAVQPELARELGRSPRMTELQERLRTEVVRLQHGRLTLAEKQLPAAEQDELVQRRLDDKSVWGAIDRLPELLEMTQPMAHLDAPLTDDGLSRGVLLAGADDTAAEAVANTKAGAGNVLASLRRQLPAKEQMVFDNLLADKPVTLVELGKRYGCSRESMRQMELRVLAKLAHPVVLRRLMRAESRL